MPGTNVYWTPLAKCAENNRDFIHSLVIVVLEHDKPEDFPEIVKRWNFQKYSEDFPKISERFFEDLWILSSPHSSLIFSILDTKQLKRYQIYLLPSFFLTVSWNVMGIRQSKETSLWIRALDSTELWPLMYKP